MSTKYKYCRYNGIRMRVHRVVLIQYLQRKFGVARKSDIERYVVHHIDGNGMNNDETNIMFMTRKEHSSLHSAKINRDSKGRYIKYERN